MKNLVITGATSGVGLAVAKLFIKNGWCVVGIARNLTNLELLKNELGEKFIPINVDISLPASVSKAFDVIWSKVGCIDILVNNAAIFVARSFTELTIEEIDQIIDVNLKGTIYCTFNAIKIISPKGGRIINIGSVAGEYGIRNQSIYCASKFGIDGFAEALNQELLEKGINISTISPGGINTPLWNQANPYPGGDTTKLLTAYDIAKLVEYISQQPANVVLKKIIAFPSNEWH